MFGDNTIYTKGEQVAQPYVQQDGGFRCWFVSYTIFKRYEAFYFEEEYWQAIMVLW